MTRQVHAPQNALTRDATNVSPVENCYQEKTCQRVRGAVFCQWSVSVPGPATYSPLSGSREKTFLIFALTMITYNKWKISVRVKSHDYTLSFFFFYKEEDE